jgi:hypothetical protein
MKIKTIKKTIEAKCEDWIKSITDKEVQDIVRKNAIVTGGCIASMLLREEVNDFDIYLKTREAAIAVARYYVSIFGHDLQVDENTPDRVRMVKPVDDGNDTSLSRGESAGDFQTITDPGAIEDSYEETQEKALKTEEDDKPKYRPLFITTNAITLSNKVQIVLRFYGEPDEIHKNYDYVHCTNYWSSWDKNLCLRQEALESLMSKELRYVGSKYPVCSVIRLRKFIARQWTINAGQILKMLMQINELDLTDIKVLQDQLTGVDSAYFCELIGKLKDKDPQKVNSAYLCEIIDRIF